MSPRRLFLLPLLALLATCGGDVESPAPASESTVGQPINSTVHFLCFSRLQGFGEAVPCRGDADVAPLAAASRLRDELRAQGDGAWLVCIGDSTVQTALIVRSPAAIAAAEARSLVMLDAMAAAGVDFYVPSHGDFFLGERRLLDEARQRGLRVLLSNVEMPGTEGEIESYAVVDHAGLKIALFGAIAPQSGDPSDPAPSELVIAKPVRRVPKVAEAVLGRGEAHTSVLFSNLAGKSNQAICDAGNSVHFIIGSSDTGFAADRAVVRHGVTMMSMRTGGRELGQTTLRITDGSFSLRDLSQLYVMPAEVSQMEAALAGWISEYGTDDPRVLASYVMPGDEESFFNKYTLIEQDKAWIEENRAYTGSAIMHHAAELPSVPADDPVLAVLARQPEAMHAAVDAIARAPAPIDADSEVTHPDECIKCHHDQYDFWAATGHARAYQLLADIGREDDSTCLHCHAAAFGDQGGFSDPRLDGPFGGVTCYNCHFARQSHSRTPRTSVDPLFVHSDTSAMLCENCHTGRQDPGFDLATALPRVSCPPMRPDDPVIVQTLAEGLEDVRRREATENATVRDIYRKGLILMALGHPDEGIESLEAYARSEESTPKIVGDVVDEIERVGRSTDAQDLLRQALSASPQDPELNLRYLQLLVHARDPSVRDPEQVLHRLPLLIPDTQDVDENTLPFRIVQVEALLAVGRQREAAVLFAKVQRAAPNDKRVAALTELIGGR